MAVLEAVAVRSKLHLLALVLTGTASCHGRTEEPLEQDVNLARPAERDRTSISETARYRCDKGEIVEVDWMTHDGHPRLRTSANPQTIDLKLAGNDYIGRGFALNGVETMQTIRVTWPGGKTQACSKMRRR